jgi:hypothetical protein
MVNGSDEIGIRIVAFFIGQNNTSYMMRMMTVMMATATMTMTVVWVRDALGTGVCSYRSYLNKHGDHLIPRRKGIAT